MHEKFDKWSNIGLVTTTNKDNIDGNDVIIAISTTINKTKSPLKEEPTHFEQTTTLGKWRHSSASSTSRSSLCAESLIPIVNETKFHE